MPGGLLAVEALLRVTFTQILVGVRSKSALSLLFCSAAAILVAGLAFHLAEVGLYTVINHI